MLDGTLDIFGNIVGRDDKIGEGQGHITPLWATTPGRPYMHVNRQRGELKETDVALFDRLFVQDLARDSHEPHVDICLRRLLLGDFIQLESKIPTENIHAVRRGCVLACSNRALELGNDVRHIANRDGRVHRADVNHPPALDAVQPDVTVDRARVVRIQDEFGVCSLYLLSVGRWELGFEFFLLPHLPLVLAEILDDERAHVVN